MRTRYLGALATLLASAGLTFGQDKAAENQPAPADPDKVVAAKGTCDKGACDKGSCSNGSCAVGQASTDCGDGVIIGTPLWSGDCSCKKEFKDPCTAWVSAEYLLWWLKDAPAPSTGLGGATSDFDYGTSSGVRVSAGLTSEDHDLGFEASFFILERAAASVSATTAGPIPTGAGVIPAGAAASAAEWERFWGGDALFSKAAFGAVSNKSRWEVDFLGGFEYLDLGERLNAQATGQVVAPPVAAPAAGVVGALARLMPRAGPAAVHGGYSTRGQF
jgi:hypothetical protein